MHALIVGGTNFVGFEVTQRLLREGCEVTLLALDPPAAEVAEHVRWIQCDRNDVEALKAKLDGCRFDAVIDNIAYVHTHVDKLLQALDGRFSRYILTSTINVYEADYPRRYAEFQASLEPSDYRGATGHQLYVRGKRSCEKALIRANVPWTVLRPTIVTGRRDNVAPAPSIGRIGAGGPSRSLFFPCRVLDGGPILLRDDDESIFNLTWVRDVAAAISVVMRSDLALRKAYNVASDELWNSERLVLALFAAAGREADIVRVSDRMLRSANLRDYQPPYGRGPSWSAVDNQRLKGLGWKPTPAGVWQAHLLESSPPRRSRGWYERRVREIALAHYVRRQRQALPRFQAEFSPAARRFDRPLAGRMTAAAAESWRDKVFGKSVEPAAAMRSFLDRPVSGYGIGTWMGDNGVATDDQYVAAIAHAVKNGINVIDTAINYRDMLAERCVGRAIRKLAAEGIAREAILVSTKGGFIARDGANSHNYFGYTKTAYVDAGLINMHERRRRHSISAAYIEKSLDQSLNNLGLAGVDVYYLHNPEVALPAIGPERFYPHLERTFAVLEHAATQGRIGCYGLATWDGLQVPPADPRHLSLERAVAAAESLAGKQHHFKAVQMPYSAARLDAYVHPTQSVGGRMLTPLQAAGELGLYVFSSGSLGQARAIPDSLQARLAELAPDLSRHAAMLRLLVSTPGLGTALIGMRQTAHVDDALRMARSAPFTAAEVAAIANEAVPLFATPVVDWTDDDGSLDPELGEEPGEDDKAMID